MDVNIAEKDTFAMRHLLAVFLGLGLLSTPVLAQDTATLYDVSGVAVDVTSDNAAQARDKAIMQAQHDAFGQLMAKLNATAAVAKTSDNDIAAMVKSFEVQDERVSPVRYMATFTVHFRPTTIRNYLDHKGISYSETVPADANAAPGGNTENGEAAEATDATQEPAMEMDIDVPVGSLAEWAQIKRKLEAIPSLSAINVTTMQRGLAQIEITYRGDVEGLQSALRKQDLTLQPDISGAWILRKVTQ